MILLDIQIGNVWTKCLVDSGIDILVIKTSVVDPALMSSLVGTQIKFVAAFVNMVQATLLNLPCSV